MSGRRTLKKGARLASTSAIIELESLQTHAIVDRYSVTLVKNSPVFKSVF